MKSLVFFSLSLLLCSYRGYKKEEPCAKSELKGRIRILTEELERKGDNYEYQRRIYSYDKQANLSSEWDSTYTRDKNDRGGSSSVSVIVYTYRKGRLAKEVTNPDALRSVVADYVYDKKGRLQAMVKYAQLKGVKDTIMLTRVIYQDKGSVRETAYLSKGEETGKERGLYDAKDNMTEAQVYDRKEERFLTTNKYGYDSEGNMLYKEVYDLYKESLQYTIRYQYSGGQLAGETWEGMNSREIKYIWSEPDAQGNYRVKTVVYKPGQEDVVTRSVVYY